MQWLWYKYPGFCIFRVNITGCILSDFVNDLPTPLYWFGSPNFIFATVLKSWHGSSTLLYNCFRYVKESEDDIINFPIKTFLLAYFFLQKTVVTSKEYVHVEYLDCKRITEFRTFYRTAWIKFIAYVNVLVCLIKQISTKQTI